MITVIILNWARPQNTVANLNRYASYRLVSQILCFNNGPSLRRFGPLPQKCVLVEASRDLGLYSRFAAASLAKTDAVLHTDDDIFVPEATVEALYKFWRGAPHCCHGLFGRSVRPVYQTNNVFGPVEVVLTRALICSRMTNNWALSAVHLFDDLRSEPHGNGEDIILSFAAMALSRTLNFVHRLPSQDYPDYTENAIHRRCPNHLQHRQSVASRCRQVFSLG
jgi:hypothetical protein